MSSQRKHTTHVHAYTLHSLHTLSLPIFISRKQRIPFANLANAKPIALCMIDRRQFCCVKFEYLQIKTDQMFCIFLKMKGDPLKYNTNYSSCNFILFSGSQSLCLNFHSVTLSDKHSIINFPLSCHIYRIFKHTCTFMWCFRNSFHKMATLLRSETIFVGAFNATIRYGLIKFQHMRGNDSHLNPF